MSKFGENLMRNEKVSFNTNFLIWTPGEGSILHPGGWFTYDMMMRLSYKFCTSLVKIKWKIKKLYGKYELSIFFIWTPGEGSIVHPGEWFKYDMMIRQPYKLLVDLPLKYLRAERHLDGLINYM